MLDLRHKEVQRSNKIIIISSKERPPHAMASLDGNHWRAMGDGNEVLPTKPVLKTQALKRRQDSALHSLTQLRALVLDHLRPQRYLVSFRVHVT